MLEQYTNEKEQTKCKIKIFIRFRPIKTLKRKRKQLKNKIWTDLAYECINLLKDLPWLDCDST